MATNPFDQFDTAEANPFDKFDKPAEKSSAIRKLADYPLAVASGAVGAVKSIADAAGAGNTVSGVLDNANKGINSYLSPEAKAEDQQISALMGDARAKGMNWEGVKAGAEAFGVAPLRTSLSGLGSIAPVIAGAALTGGGALAPVVAGGIGVAMGAGTAKGSIYDDIKKRSLAGGMNEADAVANATKAQEYGGVNTDQIALGGALGAADALTGVSRAASSMLGQAIRKPATKAAITAPQHGMLRNAGMGVLGEMPLEAAQGGQEQLAANIAAQRAGFQAGTWDNVASSATMEALASAGPGAAFGAMHGRNIAPEKPMGALEAAASLAKDLPLTQEGAQKQADAKSTAEGKPYEVAPHDSVAGRFTTVEAANKEGEFNALAATETKDLQVQRANLQRDAQKQQEVEQLYVQSKALEKAGALEGETALSWAMNQARARKGEPTLEPVAEAPTHEPRIVERTPDMKPIPRDLAELQVDMAGGEVARVLNRNGKYGYVVIPEKGVSNAATPGKNVDTPAPSANTGGAGLDDRLRNDNPRGSAVAAGQEAAPRQNGAPAAVDGTGDAGTQGRTEAVNPIQSAYDLRESTKPRIQDTDILDNGKPFATPFSAAKVANELGDGYKPFKLPEGNFVVRKADDAQSAQAQTDQTGTVEGTSATQPAAADTTPRAGVVEANGVKSYTEKFHGKVPEVTRISADKLEPKNTIEMSGARSAQEGSGLSPEAWAKTIDLSEPIQASVFSDGGVQVQDGHHRMLAAKILGKPLNVDLQAINAKPEAINGLIAESTTLSSQPKEINGTQAAKAVQTTQKGQAQPTTGQVNANPLQAANGAAADPNNLPATAVSAVTGDRRLPADRLEPTLQPEPKMVQGVPEAVQNVGKEVSRDIGILKQGRSEANAKQTAKDLAKQNSALDYSVEADDKLKNGYVVVGRERVAPIAPLALDKTTVSPKMGDDTQTATQNIAPQTTDALASGTIEAGNTGLVADREFEFPSLVDDVQRGKITQWKNEGADPAKKPAERGIYLPNLSKSKLAKLLTKESLSKDDVESLKDYKYLMLAQQNDAAEKGFYTRYRSDGGGTLVPTDKFLLTNIETALNKAPASEAKPIPPGLAKMQAAKAVKDAPIPITPPAIRVEQMRQQKIKSDRAGNLRNITHKKSPFLAFLGKHGVALSERNEFSPDKNPMLSGYGPMFRRNGLSLDGLVENAVEEGYLPHGTNDQTALHELISRQLRGDKIEALYTEDGAANVMQDEIDKRASFEDYVEAASDNEVMSNLGFIPEDEDVSGYSNLSAESQNRIQALLAQASDLGIDAESILEKVQDETREKSDDIYYAEAIRQLEEVNAAGAASSRQDAGQQSQASSEEGLSAPSREDILAQQSQKEQEEQRQKDGGDKALPNKPVTADQVDLFNTQASVFDVPAETAPEPRSPEADHKAAQEDVRVRREAQSEAKPQEAAKEATVIEKDAVDADISRWESHKKDHIKGKIIGSFKGLNIEYRPADNNKTPYDMPTFTAIDKNGTLVGLLKVDVTGKVGKGVIEVAPKMRRLGIASTLYKLAEKELGITMKPEDSHTADAKSFWGQPDRQFGENKPATKDAAAFSRADNAQTDTPAFRESDYRPVIVSWAKDEFGDRIAPSGNPTWQNFVRWFGDSKVVDSAGRPLVVYHGTKSDFTIFDLKAQSQGSDKYGKAFYFTSSPKYASQYAMASWSPGDGSVGAYYIKGDQVSKERDVYIVKNSEDIKSATGNNGNFDATNPDIRYSQGSAATGLPTSQVQAITDSIKAKWANAPEIIVASNMDDKAIPQAVRDHNDAQLSQGAEGSPEGFLYGGKVYLVADQLNTPTDVMRVLFHETLGHVGLRGVFGKELTPILQQIAMFRKAEVQAKAKEYGLDMSKESDRLQAAEEVLAVLAQTKPELGFVKRAVAAIRTWLKAHGVKLELSDSDIIANYILPARAWVQSGKEANFNGATAFSRLDNFKAWFANSRVKDMSGQAATVYHGTSSDFSVFDKLKLGTQTAHHATSKLGFFFTTNAEKAGSFAKGEGANVMAVNLRIENPYQMTVTEAGQIQTEDMARAKREDLQKAGYDGIRIANGGIWVAFEANQIKSATGNNGNFDASNPDIRFSRTGDVVDALRSANTLRQATNTVKDMLHTDRTFNMWERTIGTQFQKASKSAPFKRVFAAYNNQTDDIAHYAIEAERFAPSVLQRLDGFQETVKAVVSSFSSKYKADITAIAKPLLANIEGVKGVKQVKYDTQSLKQIFNLTDKQVEMYKQVRLSVDTSLERLAQTYAAQMGADQGIPIDTLRDMGLQETVDLVKEYVTQADTEQSAALLKRLDDMVAQTTFLQDNAYMPAMRFGNFAVTMKDGDTVAHFSMYDSQLKANIAAGKLKRENPSLKVSQSLMNEDRFKMFKGVSPETVELFAQFTGMDSNEAYQDYIALAKSGRSSAKRLLEREGVAGFDEDITRILASFVSSNARQAAMNMNQSEITAAMSAKDLQGDVQNEAQKLDAYLSDPQEEAQRLRGFLFLHYIGGSIASAAVNLTQPVLQTGPYISQFVSAARAVEIMLSAAKMAATGNIAEHLKTAMARAKAEGITDPHEIHNLMADASGATMGGGLRTRALVKAWGSLFSISEAYNRRLTFLAAYQVGLDMGGAQLKEKGFKDAYDFSKHAIIETQGLYSKTNRPNWARGAVGATLFTFKQFSISYVEFLSRLPNKQKAIALGLLVLAAGLQGLPGADDLEDLIDTIGQSLGYNTNSKKALRQTAVDLLGEDLGLLLTHGMSSMTNVDLQGRLGMGNLLPGTGLFKMSEKDKTRSATEFAGVTGGLINSAMDAVAKAQKGEIWGKTGALATMSPVTIRNFLQGAEAMQTGTYTDTRGRKVQDIDGTAAFLKMLGFQPGSIAQESRKISELMQTKGMLNAVSGAISDKWAESVATGDRQGVMEAMATLKAWNENNPESRIILNPATIRQKILAFKMTREQRFLKTLPKTMRASAMEELA